MAPAVDGAPEETHSHVDLISQIKRRYAWMTLSIVIYEDFMRFFFVKNFVIFFFWFSPEEILSTNQSTHHLTIQPITQATNQLNNQCINQPLF